jgi:DNA-binding LacI/PurR family transcriptional regulator
MSNRVTLSQIARELGLAKSTVSMALRGNHTIRLSTRLKIQKTCQSLGYRPSPLLASLGRRRFRSSKSASDIPIAFISADPRELKEKVMLEDAVTQAPELGYKVAVYPVKDLAGLRDPGRVLYSRGVQGIILPHFFNPDSLRQMDWTPFSVVALGHAFGTEPSAPGFHHVTDDHHETITGAWNRALAAGYRRIGAVYCQHLIPIRDDELRYAALLYCQEKTPKSRRVPIFNEGTLFGNSCNLRPWLERYRPDVVLGMTSGNFWDIHRAGYRIPDDVAFLNLHRELPEQTPELRFMAGMTQVRAEIKIALELLDQEVRLRHRGVSNLPRTVLLHPHWTDGESMPIPNPRQ